MKIIPTILKHLIKEAHAQVNIDSNLGVTMCYLGTADLEQTVTRLVQWIYVLVAPLIAFVMSIVHAIKLRKRKAFSLYHAVYHSFLRVLIYTLIVSVLISIFIVIQINDSLVTGDGYTYNSQTADIVVGILLWFAITVGLVFGSTGIGYLLFSFHNKTFLKLGLSYLCIIPSIVIFCVVVAKNMSPAKRATLPPDAIIEKKKDLQDKLKSEGKLPPIQTPQPPIQ